MFVEKSSSYGLYKITCHVMSKVSSISKNTEAVDILLMKFRVTWTVNLINRSVVM